ncbi:MAG: dTMP kinase [Firmicutes bacterium]|nr:dTMP kinase [Bacillota bacterium]
MKGPLFVTFEGIDGSGKSSQIRWLCRRLREMGVEVVVTREPGGTRLGESIRSILLDPASGGMSLETEVLLYSASRAQHVADVIRPALGAGKVVICERYVDSTIAYQCFGGGCDPEAITTINRFATGGLMPDLTLLLDVDPGTGTKRRSCRAPDRIEGRAGEYHQKVREGYLAIARREPGRVKVVDASLDIRVVGEEILGIVRRVLTTKGMGA